MNIANLIAQHAAAEAAAGNWSGVAATLNAQSLIGPGVRISGKATIVGLTGLGIDPDRIRTVLESTPSGRGLLGLLDAGTTVDWIDPVTVGTLAKNTGPGKLSDADVSALKSLSRRFAVVTAAECESAWKRKRDEDDRAAITARITNAAALASERIKSTDTAEQQTAKWAQAWVEAV